MRHMTQQETLTREKVSVIERAQYLRNVSKTCHVMGMATFLFSGNPPKMFNTCRKMNNFVGVELRCLPHGAVADIPAVNNSTCDDLKAGLDEVLVLPAL
jgi:hypothetical protein